MDFSLTGIYEVNGLHGNYLFMVCSCSKLNLLIIPFKVAQLLVGLGHSRFYSICIVLYLDQQWL